jgi:hypothetical protein
MRFTIRDVLLVMVIVGLAVGWWIDRDRIRRDGQALKTAEKALADEVAKLQALPLKQALAMLRVAEAELASMQDIKQKHPGALSDAEMRILEAKVEVAKLSVEKAEAKDEAAAIVSIQAKADKAPATHNRP